MYKFILVSILVINFVISAKITNVKSNSRSQQYLINFDDTKLDIDEYSIILSSPEYTYKVLEGDPNLVKVKYSGFVRGYYTGKIVIDSKQKFSPIRLEIKQNNPVKKNRFVLKDSFFSSYINYSSLKDYKVERRNTKSDPFFNREGFQISVSEDGIYRVDHYDFLRLGYSLLSFDPKKFKLYNEGVEIPIYVSGESDGKFDTYDYFEFYGEKNLYRYRDKNPNRYLDTESEENIYTLVFDGEDGKRLLKEDGAIVNDDPFKPDYFRNKIHFEKDYIRNKLQYVPHRIDPDLYFYKLISGGENEDIVFPLSNISELDLSVKYSVTPVLISDDYTKEFNLLMSINEKNFETSWIGPDPKIDSTEIKLDYINEGNNIFNISNINPLEDDILLNWFDITYSSKFISKKGYLKFSQGGKSIAGNYYTPMDNYYQYSIDGFNNESISLYKLGVSKFENFQIESYEEQGKLKYRVIFQDYILSPTTFIAIENSKKKKPKKIAKKPIFEKSLYDSDNSADYIVITDSLFLNNNSFLSYIDRKESNQFSENGVKIIDINQIFDQFSYGEWTAESLHDFFKYMVKNWSVIPTHVTLIGTAAFDHKKYSNVDLVPFKTFQHFKRGAVASDYILSTMDEGVLEEDKRAPQFYIGRIPAKNNDQLNSYLDKVERYESPSLDGPQFIKRLKDYYILTDAPEYDNLKEIINNHTEKIRFQDRLLLWNDTVSVVPPEYQGGTATLQYKWDEGLGEVNYFGHGSGEVWANSSLLLPEDIESFLRNDYLPIIFGWTCFSGNFVLDPLKDEDDLGLTEALLFTYKKGGVAVVSPTGNSQFEQNFEIFTEVNRNKLKEYPTLGEYFTRSIFSFYLKYTNMDDNKGYKNLHQYTILGDPTLKISYSNKSNFVHCDHEYIGYNEVITFSNIPQGLGKVELYNSEDHKLDLQNGEGIINSETLVNGSISLTIPSEEECNKISNEGRFITARFFLSTNNGEYLSDYKVIYLNDSYEDLNFRDLSTIPNQEEITPNDSISFRSNIYSKFEIESVKCFIDTLGNGNFDTIIDQFKKDQTLYTSEYKIKPFPRKHKIRYYFESLSNGITFQSNIDSVIIPIGDLSHNYSEITVSDSIFGGVESLVKLGSPFPSRYNKLSYEDIVVSYYVEEDSVFNPIGNDTLSLYLKENRNSVIGKSFIQADLPNGEFRLKVDINSNRAHEEYLGFEPPFENNVRINSVRNYRYLVSDTLGTSINGVHSKVSMNNLEVEILAGAISDSDILNLDTLNIESFSLPNNLKVYENGGKKYIYKASLFRNKSVDNDAEITIKNIEGNLDNIEGYSLYCYDDISNKWMILETEYEEIKRNTLTLKAKTRSMGLFGIFKNSDKTPPIIEMNIEGQNYTDNGFIPSECTIILTAKDISGVDPNSIVIRVDNQLIDQSEYKIINLNSTENSVKVKLKRSFTNGSHSVEIEASDYSKNSSDIKKNFQVTDRFTIEYHGNYPNPFKNKTVFSYKVSSLAEKVNLKIYTVSGRLIKEFKAKNVINYSEFNWDGRDNSGDLVANGVYFYKLIIKSNGKTYKETGKMAKLRK